MGRGKSTKKSPPQMIQIEKLEIENKVEIDYDKLAQAIAKANQLHKEVESLAAEKAQRELIAKRRSALGEKDFSHIHNRLWRNIRTAVNQVIVFIKLLFVPQDIAKDLSAVDILFKLITSMFFGLARMILYIIAGICAVYALIQKLPMLILYGIVIFMFAQLIRIAQIEVEHMEDRGYLMAITGTIIAIASLVVAILSEFEVI